MSFLQTIKNNLPWVRRPANDSSLRDFMSNYGWSLQSASRPMGNYEVYYKADNNPIVHRCIEVYEDVLLGTGFKINDPKNDTEEYDPQVNYLTSLFNDPLGIHEDDTFATLHYQYMHSHLLTGDAFIEVNFDNIYDKIPNGFVYIPPELMFFDTETDQWGIRNSEHRYENDELVHIYKPITRLKGGKWGRCNIDRVALQIRYMFTGWKNNGDELDRDGLDPSAIISFDKEIPANTVQREIDRIKTHVKNGNRKEMLITQGLQYHSTKNSNKEMDFSILLDKCRDMIATSYGVPPAKLGIIESGNLGGGTGTSQDKTFKDVLNGEARLIQDRFNKVLGRAGFDEFFSYGEYDIADKKMEAEIRNIDMRNGMRPINEVRAELGLTPVEWGNVPMNYNQFGVLPVSNDPGDVEPLGGTVENSSKELAKIYNQMFMEY